VGGFCAVERSPPGLWSMFSFQVFHRKGVLHIIEFEANKLLFYIEIFGCQYGIQLRIIYSENSSFNVWVRVYDDAKVDTCLFYVWFRGIWKELYCNILLWSMIRKLSASYHCRKLCCELIQQTWKNNITSKSMQQNLYRRRYPLLCYIIMKRTKYICTIWNKLHCWKK
jgi:hypothetical protein